MACCEGVVVPRGTNRTIRLTVKDAAGAVIDLTSAKGLMMVKVDVKDADVDAIIEKRTANNGGSDTEFKVTDPTNGIAEVYVIPSDTASLEPAQYVFAVKMLLNTGKQFMVVPALPFRVEPTPIEEVIA